MNEKKGFYNQRTGLIIMFVGLAIFILAFIFMNPLGQTLGVSESPGRIVLLYIFAVAFCIPWAIFWMWKFAQKPERLAMPGRYIEGMKVAVFSPYSLVAIGIVGALFAAAGLGDLGGIDLQAMIIAASAALFGSVVSYFGLFVGQIIARVLINPVWVGGVSAGALSLLPYTLIDASIWAYAGFIYFRYFHEGEGSLVKRFLIAWILAEPINQIFWFMTYWIMQTRESAILAVLNDWVIPGAGTFFGIPYWWLSGLVFVPVGLIAGSAAYRALKGGRSQTKTSTA
jgi:hypothetical protein